ncbi:hypothetical protein D3C72_1152160 [compost metagenome]
MARAGNRLSAGRPEHDIIGTQLVFDALEHQARCCIGHLGELRARRARPVGHGVGSRVERDARQIHPCVQRTFHLHIKPAFDRTRNKLVGHKINHHARQHAHESKCGRELEQQLATKTLGHQATHQAAHTPQHHQSQEARHADVDAQQHAKISLVEHAVVGGQR